MYKKKKLGMGDGKVWDGDLNVGEETVEDVNSN